MKGREERVIAGELRPSLDTKSNGGRGGGGGGGGFQFEDEEDVEVLIDKGTLVVHYDTVTCIITCKLIDYYTVLF